MESRGIDGVAVPYVTPTAPGPVAFDVFPKGKPGDFSPNTGVAWIDVVSSDIEHDGVNYESLRLGILADGTAHVGAAHGGKGEQRPLVLQMGGGPIVMGRAMTPTSSTAPCVAGEVAWDEQFSYVCVTANHWKRSPLADW